MSRKMAVILSSLSMVVFFCSFGFAQPPDNQWGVGARLSYYAADSTSVPSGGTFDPDKGVLFEGNVTWYPVELFSLEFTLGYTENTAKLTEPGLDIDFADVKQIPLLLTGRFHWWNSGSTLSLYGGGGFGYYLNDFEPTGALQAQAPGISFDADNSFGYHLAGGLEWFFTQNWGLNVDLKYIWNETDVTANDPNDPPPETDKVNLDAFAIGLGIKYYF